MAVGSVTPPRSEAPLSSGLPGRQTAPDRADAGPQDDTAATPRIIPLLTPLDAAVAAALGHQDGMALMFGLARALQGADGLPGPLAKAIRALLAAPLGPDAGASDVRSALVRSGLFHEHLMRQTIAGGTPAPVPLPVDLKGILAMLAAALRSYVTAETEAGGTTPASTDPRLQPPPRSGLPVPQPEAAVPDGLATDPGRLGARLLEVTSRAAARLVLHQAASLDDRASAADHGDVRHLWSFEIPLAGPAGVSMAAVRLEADADGGRPAGGERSFRVDLGFDVDPIGPVQARVGLFGRHRIVVGLWCERPEAVTRIGSETPAFRRALEAAGLDVTLDLHIGRPPAPEPPPPRSHRLDVRL